MQTASAQSTVLSVCRLGRESLSWQVTVDFLDDTLTTVKGEGLFSNFSLAEHADVYCNQGVDQDLTLLARVHSDFPGGDFLSLPLRLWGFSRQGFCDVRWTPLSHWTSGGVGNGDRRSALTAAALCLCRLGTRSLESHWSFTAHFPPPPKGTCLFPDAVPVGFVHGLMSPPLGQSHSPVQITVLLFPFNETFLDR